MSLNVSGYNISDIYVGDNKIDSIFVGEDLVYSSKNIMPLCFASDDSSVISTVKFEAVEYRQSVTGSTAHPVEFLTFDASHFSNYSDPPWVYSYDLINWNNYTLGTDISIGGNYPDKVYLKCTGNYSSYHWVDSYTDADMNSYWSAMHCVMTGGNIRASGSINSLIYVDYADEVNHCYLPSHIFACMFRQCYQLITPPDLPATHMQNHCYFGMFEGCEYLTTAPELPAEDLDEFCYDSMFRQCIRLESVPALPATTLIRSCYYMMFRQCTALTTAPELPATTLIDYCYYYMFESCSSLESAPELPATTLATYCYSSMFSGCTSLSSAPELPATTLAIYCYNWMFNGCTSLINPPLLPATTLATYCYNYMFDGCTSLAYIPELPATTLADYCYQNMFTNDAVRASGGISDPCVYMYRIPATGTGSGGTKSLMAMFTSASGSSTYTPSINSVLYVNKPILTTGE